MPRLSHYVLRQLIGPTAFFAFVLSAVVWLSQSLRLLDLVINRGQSAPTFLYLTLLMLPNLLVIILPIAFYAGTLFGLNKLNSDSELVAMTAAGYSSFQLAVPVLVVGLLVTALTYVNTLWLMPFTQQAMEQQEVNIRADIGAAILTQGTFNTPAPGLTVFIRDLSSDGQIHGILVHDNRDTAHPITYIAQSGLLAQTPKGARLIMRHGTIEQSSQRGAKLSVLKFRSYVFDLDQFANAQSQGILQIHERYLSQLFWPHLPASLPDRQKLEDIFVAEGHNRLAEPLYSLVFALIALAAVTQSRRARGTYALRLFLASSIAGGIRILGYGVQGLAARDPMMIILIYLVPLGSLAVTALYLSGWHRSWRLKRVLPEPAT